MYFEPAKKTYYRFPSTSSINDLDSRYYFPETHKPGDEDDTRFENKSHYSLKSQDQYLD